MMPGPLPIVPMCFRHYFLGFETYLSGMASFMPPGPLPIGRSGAPPQLRVSFDGIGDYRSFNLKKDWGTRNSSRHVATTASALQQ